MRDLRYVVLGVGRVPLDQVVALQSLEAHSGGPFANCSPLCKLSEGCPLRVTLPKHIEDVHI